MRMYGEGPALSEVDRITRLVLKHPRDAFGGPKAIEAEWRTLGFTAPPDFARAVQEFDGFLELVGRAGAEILSQHEAFAAWGITVVGTLEPPGRLDSMGANVLALAPRRVLMVAGNPRTRALVEQAGAEVLEYSGREISLKGGGGPTCLTQPIARILS